jgi:23S rRNA (adenine2503-C2)-methyltransferase
MELIRTFGKDDLAKVYVLKLGEDEDRLVECVESLQPPRPRSEKWVLIISTLFGCPVSCRMCDAGGWYKGRLSAEEIMEQIRFLVRIRFDGDSIPVKKFKIQFARMGEPALNPALLDVLECLPQAFHAPGLLPSVSSVIPKGTEPFFERLREIKNEHYDQGRFQLQFSIHSTDPETRKAFVPRPVLDFERMGRLGERFRAPGDQRITLNIAAARDVPLEPERLRPFFDPKHFLIKLTPLNPTERVLQSGLSSVIDPERPETGQALTDRFERAGYQVILSIGEREENAIGSNCGQYITYVRKGQVAIREGYTSERYA